MRKAQLGDTRTNTFKASLSFTFKVQEQYEKFTGLYSENLKDIQKENSKGSNSPKAGKGEKIN